jgi:hypothetical protein
MQYKMNASPTAAKRNTSVVILMSYAVEFTSSIFELIGLSFNWIDDSARFIFMLPMLTTILLFEKLTITVVSLAISTVVTISIENNLDSIYYSLYEN